MRGLQYMNNWWWFPIFFWIFTPNLREMIQFDFHIFQMGWNHQLVTNRLNSIPKNDGFWKMYPNVFNWTCNIGVIWVYLAVIFFLRGRFWAREVPGLVLAIGDEQDKHFPDPKWRANKQQGWGLSAKHIFFFGDQKTWRKIWRSFCYL